MTKQIDDFLALCERMFERMEQEGSWPWDDDEPAEPDSTLGGNLLDSDH